MDLLLENDTCGTCVDLDEEQSKALLEFLYLDQLLLLKVVEQFADKHYTMEQILEKFWEREWYNPPQKRCGRWSSLSGYPSLEPKSIKNHKMGLEKFLNNVLGVVSSVCNMTFVVLGMSHVTFLELSPCMSKRSGSALALHHLATTSAVLSWGVSELLCLVAFRTFVSFTLQSFISPFLL